MSSSQRTYTILDEVSATTEGQWVFCADYRNVQIQVDTSAGYTGTLKFYISNAENPPKLSSSASVTNQYTPVMIVDIDDQTPYDGSTGLVIAASEIHKTFEANLNRARWIVADLTHTGGTISVKATLFDNS